MLLFSKAECNDYVEIIFLIINHIFEMKKKNEETRYSRYT